MNATIGDAIGWRAMARANDIPRRPAHAPRPDRGWVDQQPVETPRPPSVIPLERLLEAQELSENDMRQLEDELSEELAEEEPALTPEKAAELAMSPPEPANEALPPSAGPSTVGQANLVRFERATHYAPPPEPANDDIAYVGSDGRRFHTDAFRRRVVKEFIEERAGNPSLSQRVFGARYGLHQTLISVWVKEYGLTMPNKHPGSAKKIDAETRELITARGVKAKEEGGETLTAIANEYGIHLSNVSGWVAAALKRRDYQARAAKRLATMGRSPRSESSPASNQETQTLMSRPSPPSDILANLPPKEKGKWRVITEEQKRAILASGPELKHTELGRRYDVADMQIREWRKRYGQDGQKGKRKPRQAPADRVTVVQTTSFPPRQANGARSLEAVSSELQAALAQMNELGQRVGALKRELRDMLGD